MKKYFKETYVWFYVFTILAFASAFYLTILNDLLNPEELLATGDFIANQHREILLPIMYGLLSTIPP